LLPNGKRSSSKKNKKGIDSGNNWNFREEGKSRGPAGCLRTKKVSGSGKQKGGALRRDGENQGGFGGEPALGGGGKTHDRAAPDR